MRLLVTRPEPEAEAMAATLRAAGHDVLVEPMLVVTPVANVTLQRAGVDALLVTSANALRALEQHPDVPALRLLPLFAVGEATAELARRIGFRSVTAGPGTAPELVPILAAALAQGSTILHLAGDVLAADLSGPVREAGLVLRSAVVYQTVERQAFTAGTAEALRDGMIDAVTILSPRTARVFTTLCRSSGLKIVHTTIYCLSEACASGLGDRAARVRIAERPALASLLALIASDTAQLPARS